MQERVESDQTESYIVHEPLDRFIINSHAFHNAHLANLIPPHALPWNPSMRETAAVPGGSEPLKVGEVKDYSLSQCKVRVYTPPDPRPAAGWPVFIFFHGGKAHCWLS